MSFELLSEPIRKYIRDKRWETLRPIQTAAINKILSTNSNYILASRTASGKTEAAFLPILSKINFNEPGIQVLYISPLIALINDQFYRVEELCKYLDVEVTKWHGEANRTLKEKLIKNPRGIILITPESIEAMFVNASYNVKGLFSNLKYVIIDEIHSFIGTDRGIQLKSILSRIQQANNIKFNIVGLSATIGDYDEAKKMTGDAANSKVLLDKTPKDIATRIRYYKSDMNELSIELINDLYEETKDNKVLLFPNSRGRAEEIAVKLKKQSIKLNGHPFYFSHHSSVDRELREYVENFAKNNQRNNFLISCTSTLELGIDIGTVDEVVQIDATHSIASLIQRVGRSGRRDGETSYLFLYATNQWSFLQSLACWILFKEGFIEPFRSIEKPYDILLHQILSTVKATNGIDKNILVQQMQSNFAFNNFSVEEITEIIDKLVKINFLELIQRELIIGVDGERTVNSREFYSVFKTEPNFKVVNAGKKIGDIPFSPQIKVDENILLAARIWKIVDIDFKSHKIEVITAKDGKKPKFYGTGGIIHPKVRQKMLEILIQETVYEELDESSIEALREIRKEFSNIAIESLEDDRPLIIKETDVVFYSFNGTKVNRSLEFLFSHAGISTDYIEQSSSFVIKAKSEDMKQILEQVENIVPDIDFHLENDISSNPSILDFSKWGGYLPLKFQIEVLKQKFFDFESAILFLKNLRIVEKTEINNDRN